MRIRVILFGVMGLVAAITTTVGCRWLFARLEDQRLAEHNAWVASRNPQSTQNDELVARAAEEAFSSFDAEAPSKEIVREPLHDATVDGQSDATWQSLPRTTFTLLQRHEDGDHLEVRLLFRNSNLNPSDRCIGQAPREKLAAWLQPTCGAVLKLREALSKVSLQEFEFMRQQGRTHSITYSDYLRGLAPEPRAQIDAQFCDLRKRLLASGLAPEAVEKQVATTIIVNPVTAFGRAFAHGTHDGVLHWANLSEMPQSRAAASTYCAAALAMYAEITAFFVTHAGLLPADSDRMLEAVDQALRRTYD